MGLMISSLKKGYSLAGDEKAGALQVVLRLSRERDAPRQVPVAWPCR